MSYDLYLWHSTLPVSVEQAKTICDQLASEQDSPVVPDDAVLAFHEELIAHFPGLEDLSDPEDSPWNMSPDATASRVILCMGFSRVAKTVPIILEMATKYGLVCFNPSAEIVHNPPGAHRPGDLRLQSCDGSLTVNPSQEELKSQLDRLSRVNWYVWLMREEGWFVQVGIGQFAGNVPEGKFALEYREGDADRHYRVVVQGFDDVEALFSDFADGKESFKTAFAWDRY